MLDVLVEYIRANSPDLRDGRGPDRQGLLAADGLAGAQASASPSRAA